MSCEPKGVKHQFQGAAHSPNDADTWFGPTLIAKVQCHPGPPAQKVPVPSPQPLAVDSCGENWYCGVYLITLHKSPVPKRVSGQLVQHPMELTWGRTGRLRNGRS